MAEVFIALATSHTRPVINTPRPIRTPWNTSFNVAFWPATSPSVIKTWSFPRKSLRARDTTPRSTARMTRRSSSFLQTTQCTQNTSYRFSPIIDCMCACKISTMIWYDVSDFTCDRFNIVRHFFVLHVCDRNTSTDRDTQLIYRFFY